METTAVALRPHAAILPSPGIGHLIPLAEFAKILVHRHGFTITFITVEKSALVESYIDALPPAVTSIDLPTPSPEDFPPGCQAETIIYVTMARSRPSLHRVLGQLKVTTRLVAFVTDLLGVDVFDVVREFGVPKYLFFPSNAMLLQLLHHLRELDETNECEYRDMEEPTMLPGCVSIHGRDFPVPFQDRKGMAYFSILHVTKRYHEADGIIVNTCATIERGAIEAFNRPGLPEWKLHPVGPLVQADPYPEDPFDSVKWLDKQPTGSVLFVSFGSAGVLSSDQLTELATGLEMSGHRFLWVIRSPEVKIDASFFAGKGGEEDPLGFLPAGFLHRTKGMGLVLPNWAPQISVLSHEATGGFMTHCGWNSTMESLVHGVPLIAWPLYAEQRMNAVMLTEKVKVAVRPKGDGLIHREEISRVVTALMGGEEGREVRSRVKELQQGMANDVAVGGSSYTQLEEIADKWKNSAGIAAGSATGSATDG